jgi:hypothetical protein
MVVRCHGPSRGVVPGMIIMMMTSRRLSGQAERSSVSSLIGSMAQPSCCLWEEPLQVVSHTNVCGTAEQPMAWNGRTAYKPFIILVLPAAQW